MNSGKPSERRELGAPPRITRILFLLLVLAVGPLFAPPSQAHELRPAIATAEFTRDGALSLVISLNLEAAIAGIGAEHQDTADSPAAKTYDRLRRLEPSALRAAFDEFAPVFLERISIGTNAGPFSLTIESVSIPEIGDVALPRISEITLKSAVPAGADSFRWRTDPLLGNGVIRVRDSATRKIVASEYVLAGATSGPISISDPQRQGWTSVFLRYLEVGFTHILPKGLDHILFVVGLFLLSTRLSALFWQVTAFTVAHTVTLGLGMAEIVRLSPALVEPLIAASIVYVAVENMLTDRLQRWRPLAVFGFGLLHGLGFAGVLQEIGPATGQFLVSLLAFNIGVELGQLAVIALCFLAVGWAMRRAWYRRRIVIPLSAAIAVIASIWVLERTGIAL